MKRRILFLFALLPFYSAVGQTCCTGGVPYLGTFKIPAINSNEIQTNLSYSYNNNSDLVLHDEVIKDNGSRRMVHTALLQLDYGLSDRFSVSVVLPYLWQKERIEINSVSNEITNNGLGDISFWMCFKQPFNVHSLSLNAALKAPTGVTNREDPETGIDFPFSFQNGSGSWDFIFTAYDELSIGQGSKVFWVNMASAKINTAGRRFDAHPGYRFGHVLQFYTSLSIRWVMGTFLSDAYSGLAYQLRFQDRFEGGFQNENTGGDWVNLVVGYNHQFSQRMHAGASGSIPVFRKVNGLQLTTDKQINVTVGYKLK